MHTFGHLFEFFQNPNNFCINLPQNLCFHLVPNIFIFFSQWTLAYINLSFKVLPLFRSLRKQMIIVYLCSHFAAQTFIIIGVSVSVSVSWL